MIDDRHQEGAEPPDGMRVAALASGGYLPRALAVAARLRIADVLDGGSLSADAIAERTGTDPHVLRRLLHVLALHGVFERDASGRFAVTEDFAVLGSDHPRSVRNLCILLGETYDDAFGALLTTLRTGRSGFEQVFGTSLYDYLGRTPEAEEVFDAAMAELSVSAAADLSERFDFSGVRRVVDVGGGNGTVIGSLLTRNPHLEGVCVDRPSVCERARAELAATTGHPLTGRLAFHPADIFETVADGGDLYLLKNVLHDWSPEQCVRILTAVRDAMTRTAHDGGPGLPRPRLIVLEPLLDEETDAAHALFQTVLCGTRARGFHTHDDMRRLLTAAHLDLLSTHHLPGGHHAFECHARSTPA